MCYCNERRRCDVDTNTILCDSRMGACFVQIDLTNRSELEYHYGCYQQPPSNNQHLLEECLKGDSVQNFTSLLCCNDSHQCNRHLRPQLPHEYVYRTTSQDPTTTIPAIGPTSGTGMGLYPEQVWDWDVIKAFHTFRGEA